MGDGSPPRQESARKRRKVIRVVLPPRIVAHTSRRVRHGHGTTVSGWLGTSRRHRARRTDDPSPDSARQWHGTVLAGGRSDHHGKRRLDGAAPGGPVAAGRGRLRRRPDHGILHLGPGAPDRPRQVQDQDHPEVVPWGSTIRVTGRVVGGYVPVNSNLLRLNVGIGRIGHLEGLPEIQPDGRFLIVWKFDAGHGVLHPWFSVGTLSESAFPWAPGTSKRVVVTLGKRTPAVVASITTASTATESGTGGMIARHRGDTRRHSRWRPAARAPASPTPAAPKLLADDTGEPQVLDQPHARPRGSRALIALATVIGVAVIAGEQRTGGLRATSRCRRALSSGLTSGPPRRSRTRPASASTCSRRRWPPRSTLTPVTAAPATTRRSIPIRSVFATCSRTDPPPQSRPARSPRAPNGATSRSCSATFMAAGKPLT